MNTQHWKHRRVLVTGATGLLGSWLTNSLLDAGATVTCLIRDTVPQSYLVTSVAIQRVNIVNGGLEDYFTVLRAVNEYEIETVFHLGAQTIVGTASRSAMSTFESNIKGTWNLLEACSACGKLVKAIVVASSDKAYGSHPKLPYTEDTPLQGRFPYDVSKSCADLIAHSYYETRRLPVGITRCGNLYGGGDLNFSRIVPGTIRSVLSGERPVIRSDGKFVRDYFYVEDAVQAVLTLAESLASGNVHGEAFNFGTETPASVIELVDRILAAMASTDLKPIILNEANHEIREQFLDCTKARTRLNWRPSFSLDQGLARAIEWYRDFFGATELQTARNMSANA